MIKVLIHAQSTLPHSDPTYEPCDAGNERIPTTQDRWRETNLRSEGLVSNPCSLTCSGQLGGPVLAHTAPLSPLRSAMTPSGPIVASQHSEGLLHTAPAGGGTTHQYP